MNIKDVAANSKLFTIATANDYATLSEEMKTNGSICYVTSTNDITVKVDDTWNCITTDTAYNDRAPTKKYIPHPILCKCCGAPMKSYKCEYCLVEYPEFE